MIGEPLTPFGKGHHEAVGFLPLRDSMQCLTLAIENPHPTRGEYRVFNQFEEVYDVTELAEKCEDRRRRRHGHRGRRSATSQNPRKEFEEHYYNPDHQHLLDLGYQPTTDMEGELRVMFSDLVKYRDRIAAHSNALRPDINWDGSRTKAEFIGR